MLFGDFHGAPNGAKIVRTRTGRNEHQIGTTNDARDRLRNRWRRVDHHKPHPGLFHILQRLAQLGKIDLRERWLCGRSCFPPFGETRLGIDVDERHWASAGAFGLDGEMAGKRGLAGTALLGCHREYEHVPPSAGRLGTRVPEDVRPGRLQRDVRIRGELHLFGGELSSNLRVRLNLDGR